MKISELPDEYKIIAEYYRKNDSDDITCCFIWDETQQGYSFWELCHEAKTKKQLPKIKKAMNYDEERINRIWKIAIRMAFTIAMIVMIILAAIKY